MDEQVTTVWGSELISAYFPAVAVHAYSEFPRLWTLAAYMQSVERPEEQI